MRAALWLVLFGVACKQGDSDSSRERDTAPDTADSGDDSWTGEMPPTVSQVRSYVMACAILTRGGVACFGAFSWSDTHSGRDYQEISQPTSGVCGISAGAIDCWALSDSAYSEEALTNDGLVGWPTGSDWLQVERSADNNCARDTAGRISCWGYSFTPDSHEDTRFEVPTSAGWQDIAMAQKCELCALDVTGTVTCFPAPWQKEAGSCAARPFGETRYVDIDAKNNQLVGLRADGSVDMTYDIRAEDGSDYYRSARSGYRQATGEGNITCGITQTGSLDCWAHDREHFDDSPLERDAAKFEGTYVDVDLAGETLWGIDSEGQLHWNQHDRTDDGYISFWEAVGVPNPDDF